MFTKTKFINILVLLQNVFVDKFIIVFILLGSEYMVRRIFGMGLIL